MPFFIQKEQPVAVFDSGVGGISVLRELVKVMPNEDFIYYGDSENAPYGTKTLEEVRELTCRHAKELFEGVIAHLEELDLRIKHQIKNWDFEHIGDMERAILRLGAYEILFSAMDKAIVINEALEIAKNFGNEASTKFINGILDGIAKNATIDLKVIQEALQKAQEEMKNTESQETKNVSKQDSKKPRDSKFKDSKKPRDSKNNKNVRKLKDSKGRAKVQNPKSKRGEK